MSGDNFDDKERKRSSNMTTEFSNAKKVHLLEWETPDQMAARTGSITKTKPSRTFVENVPTDGNINYRILNFDTVFAAISAYVVCVTCGCSVKFRDGCRSGLGFEIKVYCKCTRKIIPSCPASLSENDKYEDFDINTRFIFTMKALGHGYNDCQTFCALMDLPFEFFKDSFDSIVQRVLSASSEVRDILLKKAVSEEYQKMIEKKAAEPSHLSVFSDGTCKKRGFSSVHGVASIFGCETGKILDIEAKSATCKECDDRLKETDSSLMAFELWYDEHKANCEVLRQNTADKLEIDALAAMFGKSIEKYGAIYRNFVGFCDSKIYRSVIESNPYGVNLPLNEKECLADVQKRMGARLKMAKNSSSLPRIDITMTREVTDKMVLDFGLAIQQHCYENVETMRDVIWAALPHFSSTNKSPQHEECPQGADSWCEYQVAVAYKELIGFQHSFRPLLPDVLRVIEPVYKDFTGRSLLERCLGSYRRGDTEILNRLIWRCAANSIDTDSTTVKIAANIAACVYNEGPYAYMYIMDILGVKIGVTAKRYSTPKPYKKLPHQLKDPRLAKSNCSQRQINFHYT